MQKHQNQKQDVGVSGAFLVCFIMFNQHFYGICVEVLGEVWLFVFLYQTDSLHD
jgi:hypothetical protein